MKTPEDFIKDTWTEMELEEAVSVNPTLSLNKGKIYKFVSMFDILPFTKKISNYELRKFKSGGSKFQNGDTLFARITPCLENGKTVYVDILDDGEFAYGSTEFLVLRGKNGITTNDYVYYLSRSPELREEAIKLMTGTSGRQRVQTEGFKSILLRIPLLIEQHVIGNILSSSDDKIEHNNLMNLTLESLAHSLFHSWFVRFDPFQDGEFIDSELGPIPKGWEVITHNDLGDIYGGGTPSTRTEEYWNGEICFLTPSDVTSLQSPFLFTTDRKITQLGLENCSSKLHPINSVFMTSRATIGEVCINDVETATNQGFIVIRPARQEFLHYIVIYLKLNTENYISVAGGSTFREINRTTFKSLKLVLPAEDILSKFHSTVKPLYERIRSNSKENLFLSSLRDLLLPQLLSGKLRIKNSEHFLEEINNEN